MSPVSSKNRSKITRSRARQGAERGLRGTEVFDDLLRGRKLEAELAGEPLDRAGRAALVDLVRDHVVEAAHGRRQLVGAAEALAEPERDRRRLALGVGDVHLAGLDFLDSIRRVAELEHVARHALEREVFVQRADRSLARQKHHVVVELIGDRATVRDRREPRAAPAAQHVVHAIEVQVRAAPAAMGREAVREHLRDGHEAVARQIAVARRAREAREQVVDLPLLHADLGDDLLCEHVERRGSRLDRVELAAADAVEQRRALDEIVARQRKEAPFRQAAEPVTRAANPLQQRRDHARRAELAHEVHVADVDAELERGRGNESLEPARLEPFLRAQPMFLREAAVVRRDRVVAEPLREVARGALREPPGIHEHERRPVRADQLREPVVFLDPDLVRHDRLERRLRQHELEIALAHVTFVDHGALRVRRAREERGQSVDRLRRGRNPDARRRRRAQRIEPLERQREMRAALVARDRMDFVDDHRAHRAQHLAAGLRREQDVERFGRRDEDVRRRAAHARPLALRRVASAHGRAYRRVAEHLRRKLAADAVERRAQVLLDVVRQRLERRDVEHLRLVAQRAGRGLLRELVDHAQERRERLARARRRADQRVRPGRESRPRP